MNHSNMSVADLKKKKIKSVIYKYLLIISRRNFWSIYELLHIQIC